MNNKIIILILSIMLASGIAHAATVTKSIGATGRDYATITLWEADLDSDPIYDAGDVAVGEMYNDAAFDEASFTFNGGGTIGLSSITLTAASGQRHTGTAGTGVRFVASTNRVLTVSFNIPLTISWFEWDANGTVSRINLSGSGSADDTTARNIQNCILHDQAGNAGANLAVLNHVYDGPLNVTNNIIYDITQTNATNNIAAIRLNNTGTVATTNIMNNTIYKVDSSGSGNTYGIWTVNAADNSTNNLVTDVTATGGGTPVCFSGTFTVENTDASSDATAGGTGSLTSITTANQFISTTNGSEDLHLKAGADAINAGTDLVTTPTGVNFDIDNRDRDAQGDVWDIGADELVAAGGARRIFIID